MNQAVRRIVIGGGTDGWTAATAVATTLHGRGSVALVDLEEAGNGRLPVHPAPVARASATASARG